MKSANIAIVGFLAMIFMIPTAKAQVTNNILEVTGAVSGHALVASCGVNEVGARTFLSAKSAENHLFISQYLAEALFQKYEIGPVTYAGKKYLMVIDSGGGAASTTNANVTLYPVKGGGESVLWGNTLVKGSIFLADSGSSRTVTFDNAVLKPTPNQRNTPSGTVTINGKAYCKNGELGGYAPLPQNIIAPTQALSGTYAAGHNNRAISLDFVSGTEVDVQGPNGKEQGTYEFNGHILRLYSSAHGALFMRMDSYGCFELHNLRLCKNTDKKPGSRASTSVIGSSTTASSPTPYNVWVVNEGGPVSGTVAEINGSTGTVVRTVTIEMDYGAIAVDHSGNVWVADNAYDGTVLEINGSTGAVSHTIKVGNTPNAIAVDHSGNVWVVNSGGEFSGTVSEINGSTGTVFRTVTVGNTPKAIAVDASGNVWVANEGYKTVSEINGSTGTVHTIKVGNQPNAIAVDASGNVWVANSVDNTVSEINGSTGTVSHTIKVGDYPSAIAVDHSGNVWVANQSSENVSEINGSTGSVARTIDLQGSPHALAVDASGHIWVADGGISEINGSTGVVSNFSNVLSSYIAADPSGNLWVAYHAYDGTVSEINGSTGTVSHTIKVGIYPRAIAVAHSGNK